MASEIDFKSYWRSIRDDVEKPAIEDYNKHLLIDVLNSLEKSSPPSEESIRSLFKHLNQHANNKRHMQQFTIYIGNIDLDIHEKEIYSSFYERNSFEIENFRIKRNGCKRFGFFEVFTSREEIDNFIKDAETEPYFFNHRKSTIRLDTSSSKRSRKR